MSRILGIDPGSRITGFGVIDFSGDRAAHVASGCIRTRAEALPERLREVYEGLMDVLRTHRPGEVAVEQVFVHRSAVSALKLGHARGAALLAGVMQGLPVHEYNPAQVKKAIVGGGRADKAQIQHMIRILLSLPAPPQADAADALAVALCHAHVSRTEARIRRASGDR